MFIASDSSSERSEIPAKPEQQESISNPAPESAEKGGIMNESRRERLKLKTNVELNLAGPAPGDAKTSSDKEKPKGKEDFTDKIKSFFAKKIEWLREKIKGTRNNYLSMLLVVLDHAMDYVKPDENGGIQDKQDLLGLADKLVEGTGSPEDKLKRIEQDTCMLHKNNSVKEFTEACKSGINFEFDLRWSGSEVVVRHNGKANNPEVTLNQYIEIMKQNPSWSGRMQLDVKDRLTVPHIKEYLDRMPANFRSEVMIGTFDPEVVMQVHENFNKNMPPGKRIPIVLHILPLMRYEDPDAAKRAAQAFNEGRAFFQKAADSIVKDASNDPQAAIEKSIVHTNYEDYQKTNEPDAEHMILALNNPIEEIMQKDRRIIEAVLFSDGEFSFPYDPKYLQWIKDNAEKTGVDFSHVGVGTWRTSPDDIYDALLWQDKKGNRIDRIGTDSKDI
jgi:hypothetical protein